MTRRLMLLAPLLLLLAPSRLLLGEAPPVQHGRFAQSDLDDWLQGTLTGVFVEGGDLRLEEGQPAGTYESQPLQVPFGLNAALARWNATVGAGQTLELELRSSVDGQTWEEWRSVRERSGPDGESLSQMLVLRPFTSWLQYRARFAGATGSPRLADVSLIYLSSSAGPALVDIIARVPPAGPVVLTPPPPSVAAIEWGALDVGEVIERRQPRHILISELPAPADDPNSAATVRALQWVAANVLQQQVLPYHFLIDGAGTIYQGSGDANVRLPGAHDRTIEIGLLADTTAEGLSEPAQAALVELLGWLGDARGIASSAIDVAADAPQRLRDLTPELRSTMEQATIRSRVFLAAGDTRLGTERVSLLNRGPVAARAVLTGLSADQEEQRSVVVPAGQRVDLTVNSAFPLTGTVALAIEADQPINAERIQIIGHELAGGPASRAPARAWYFANGSAADDETATLSILNPREREVLATVSLLVDTGVALSETIRLAPRSVQTLPLIDRADGRDFGLKVIASEPVVVERSVVATSGAATMSSGISELSRNWLFAEGSTLEGYTTTLTLLNPWPQLVPVDLRILSEDGTSLDRRYAIGAGRRIVITLNSIVPNLPFAMEVTAERPIGAERLIRFDNGASATLSQGATGAATQWTFVEGSTAIPAEQFLLVANPSSQSVDVEVDYILAGGRIEQRRHLVGARSRLTIPVNDDVPDQPIVSAILVANRPIVAERTIYTNGLLQRGAETSLGVPGR